MDFFRHDLRYAIRSVRRSAFLTVVTTLTLGLGIGVVTALFAVVDAVLLEPILADQHRMVRVWKRDVERGSFRHSVTYVEFKAWRDEARTFEAMAAVQYADAISTGVIVDGRSSPVKLTPVSANFFTTLRGGAPLHGRLLQTDDELPGAELAAVVSARFWRRAAGSDPALIGKRLAWAADPRTLLVVGIAPAEFDYPLGTDIWVPIAKLHDGSRGRFNVENRGLAHFEIVGRLAPGASLEQAHAELDTLHRRLIAQFPNDYRRMQIVVSPLLDSVVGNSRQVLLFLFAAAGLVFVIAGVNVAALLLMRASMRRKEVAVRIALGASHARLARHAVTESLVLGALGAGCGLLVAQLLLGVLRWLSPGEIPRIEHAGLSGAVLGFCAVAGMVWVLAFGTVPIWGHRRIEGVSGGGTHDMSFRGAHGTRGLRIFTIAEIAAAVVVAVAAGLLVRSFAHLQGIDRGFDSRNLAVIPLLLPESRYPDARARLAFYERLLPRVTSIAGVTSASPVHLGPGTGNVGLSAALVIEGQSPEESARNPWATWEPVTPSYFPTLGIPIVQGRTFTDADSRDAAPVVIVSEALARRYWPGQDAVGKRLRLTAQFPWVTVVGVAADVRYRELTKTWLTAYFPAPQFFFFAPGSLVVRTASPSEALLPAIRETIRAEEPYAALESIATMDALLARELSRPRTALTVAVLFAAMAMVLSAIGVYGVTSYEVRQRRRELAVRSAIGASPSQIFRAVVWRSVTLGGAGAAAGLAAASVLTRSFRSLLFNVEPTDPRAFAAGVAALLAIVLLASLLPARRAAGTDPVAVLRTE